VVRCQFHAYSIGLTAVLRESCMLRLAGGAIYGILSNLEERYLIISMALLDPQGSPLRLLPLFNSTPPSREALPD
jgi:hypothetical protein